MKTFTISLILIATLFSTSFAQESGSYGLNPLSGNWALGIEGGATYTLADFKTAKPDYFARIMGEYFLPSTSPLIFGLRLHADVGRLSGSRSSTDQFKTPIIIGGGGVSMAYAVEDNIFPYVFVGTSLLYFDPKDINGNRLPNNKVNQYSRQEFLLQGELGIRFLLEPELSLNFSGGFDYVNTDKLDDIQSGTQKDVFFNFQTGLSFYFGGEKDADKDGVLDADDACPETPQGVRVDEFGCPLDSDHDGVPDYLDRCPDTSPNVMVDNFGCPLDSDGDGVPDDIDKCSNTPPRVSVDKNGCPLDQDGDGVPDYLDNCPGTKSGVEVDKFGCPIKSQEKQLPEVTNINLSGEVNFKTGKSDLLPGAKLRLDKAVDVLRNYPQTKWRIEGHTDNTGSYQLNMRLSEQRAASVADYLISKGIDPSRLEVIGYGPDYPIGDNSTSSGRSLNRRVTIELVDVTGQYNQTTGRKSTDVSTGEYDSFAERNVGNMIFTDGKMYCYQVSSWRSYDKAVGEVNKWKSKGENAFIVEANNLPEIPGTWYRVRIGYFKTLSEAKEHRSRTGN